MAQPNQPNEQQDLGVSPRLIKALQELQKERVFVPPSVEENVLRQARLQLAHIRKRRVHRRVMAQWAAVAASLALVAGLAHVFYRGRPHSPPPARYARGDLNHDGRVDILDAFELARQIKQGQAPPKAADLNGDGRIDAADVETIARQAVSLEKGNRS